MMPKSNRSSDFPEAKVSGTEDKKDNGKSPDSERDSPTTPGGGAELDDAPLH